MTSTVSSLVPPKKSSQIRFTEITSTKRGLEPVFKLEDWAGNMGRRIDAGAYLSKAHNSRGTVFFNSYDFTSIKVKCGKVEQADARMKYSPRPA